MTNIIFDIPLNFISEYLTGWTIIIFIIIIIYFIALRKYYINKEQFYDSVVYDIENEKKNPKTNPKQNPRQNPKNTKNKTTKNKNIVEGFEITNSTPITPTTCITPISSNQKPILDIFIDTTLFDILQLNPEQTKQCKQFYNTIILYYITELIKLRKLVKNNQYFNTEKQFNIIITKGVDDIINFLNNKIKSINVVTRTSIKTDLLNILSNTLDNLIEKTNNELRNYINELAKLNSTTIDYYTMAKNINVSRNTIEDYIEIDKLIMKYGSLNSTKSENKVDKVLDKSFILPIYEKNFDRINQLVQSDFNDNYTQLAEKYGNAYTDYLNQKKKEELNINPLEMLSSIETGIINFLTPGSGSSYGNSNKENDKLIEQYNAEYGSFNNKINNNKSNPIPLQNKKLVSETTLNKNNMYKDPGNLGNYLIDKNTQKQILEGFETNTTDKPKTSTTPISNSTNNKNNKNNKIETTNIVAKLFSGDFLNYIMEIINEKLNGIYSMYNTKFNNGNNGNNNGNNGNNGNNNGNNENNFNIENNLIPAGFILFILSMLFYFIDLTS